ncbi:FAD-dependent oxidoreductase [Escherichia sp. E1130]|uniref:FAD-dependent oxidoreductase n=1 Tax=Escherichia sp. E1130 TaxID=2041645 RepID=UPI001F116E48|nr:FAD-dependent oxidoreductase [Escherichia sp. E1130]
MGSKNIAIAGGGFFGLYLAEQLALKGCKVTVYEKSQELMSRASYVNQARVHNGYHYPRSILTALRSRISFPRFVTEFRDCIEDDFAKYYLVAGALSKITGAQFSRFCQRIGAECEDAPPSVKRLINPVLIDAVFTTREYAFDSHKLRNIMLQRLSAAKVTIVTDAVVEKVSKSGEGLEVITTISGQPDISYVDHLFNCTYSRINYLLNGSELTLIPLRHEMTEMCLVTVPDELKKNGVNTNVWPFFFLLCHSHQLNYIPSAMFDTPPITNGMTDQINLTRMHIESMN